MKIMYVACNPKGSDSLMLEREITALQQRFGLVSGAPITFEAFPDLHFEDLPGQLSRSHADILHFSAHGEPNRLMLANSVGAEVYLTAATLRTYLDFEPKPKLVYLNACDSMEIAKELVEVVPIAIGTTAPITNVAAVSSAAVFYERLLSGFSVQKAFDAGRVSIEALQQGDCSSKLFYRGDIRPVTERLFHPTQIIAAIERQGRPDGQGFYRIKVGVAGCPRDTSLVVVFTDDASFITEKPTTPKDEYEVAAQLCRVCRPLAGGTVVWAQKTEDINSDYRLFACGTTMPGRVFAVSTTLCQALEAHLMLFEPTMAKYQVEATRKAIQRLKDAAQ